MSNRRPCGPGEVRQDLPANEYRPIPFDVVDELRARAAVQLPDKRPILNTSTQETTRAARSLFTGEALATAS
jgi:hypothetical protein